MCKPLTDEQLKVAEAILEVSEIALLREFLNEVRRLRAEAIEWHPWPGERPTVYAEYEVMFEDQSGGRYIEKCRWWAGSNKWEGERRVKIVAWSVVTAPWGGE